MAFDPYAVWLGIRTEGRPPTHYELLGLTPYEADPQRIRDEAQTRYALVHRYQAGRHGEMAVRLLAEITEARETLCDPVRKATYDASLGGGPTAHSGGAQQATLANAPAPHCTASTPLATSPATAPPMPLAPMQTPPAVTTAPLPVPVPATAADNSQPPMPRIETGSAAPSGVGGELITPDPSSSWTRRRRAKRSSFASVAAGLMVDNRMQPRGWVWFAAGAASMYAVMLLMQSGEITQPRGASPALSGANKPASVPSAANSERHAALPRPSSIARRSERADGKLPPSQLDGPSSAPSARDDEPGMARASQTPTPAEAMPQDEPAPGATADLSDSPRMKVPAVLETFTNSLGMKFVLIPPGEFMMGSQESPAEGPQHRVQISSPFYLGVHEVTQEQYERVMGSNPSFFRGDGRRPVDSVTWHDAVEFCRRLSERDGHEYRLPTEAEWEYACRAGSTTRWSFGDDESLLGEYAWYDRNSGGTTHPVGTRKPNPWGLYDMQGNVWEWCQDVWHHDYRGAPNDGSAWVLGGEEGCRVVRGAAWLFFGWTTQCAVRVRGGAAYGLHVGGFRVARTP